MGGRLIGIWGVDTTYLVGCDADNVSWQAIFLLDKVTLDLISKFYLTISLVQNKELFSQCFLFDDLLVCFPA